MKKLLFLVKARFSLMKLDFMLFKIKELESRRAALRECVVVLDALSEYTLEHARLAKLTVSTKVMSFETVNEAVADMTRHVRARNLATHRQTNVDEHASDLSAYHWLVAPAVTKKLSVNAYIKDYSKSLNRLLDSIEGLETDRPAYVERKLGTVTAETITLIELVLATTRSTQRA